MMQPRTAPRHRHAASLLRGMLIVLLCFVPAAGLSATLASGRSPARIRTVWLIVMENENWSDIRGSASAPYINTVLLPRASYAAQYYNPPGNHPSLPNYLWLEAGTNFGISNDDSPSIDHQSTSQHLVTLLTRAAISWRAYDENIGGSRCPLTDNFPYAVRHDPFVYFDDVTDNRSPTSRTCISHIRPFGELGSDLRQNRVARYNFLTPNLCDDMHTACSPLHDPIKQGDAWLQHTIPMITASQAYKQGGAIFITWDEAANGDGPIGLIALSPLAKGHGYHNSIHYTHSSLLRTVEEIFGVTPLLGDAAHASDLGDLFARGAVPGPRATPTPRGPGGSWQLAFDGEFTGDRLDTATWQTRFPWGPCSIPSNHEQQCYVDDVFGEANGTLSIAAARRAHAGYAYTSGMISSYASYSTTYGYVELRAQVPKGQGLWTAF